MSIDTPTELLTASSGSVGDTVFSRNQHGPYTKPRVTPTDPGTPLQVSLRAHLSTCCLAWRTTLTQPEREGWDAYALAVRLASPLGRTTHAGGVAMYVRSNVPRLQAAERSIPRVDVAPALYNLGSFALPDPVLLDHAADKLQVWFTESDAWATDPGAAMLIYASPAVTTAVHYYKGPYRYAGCILGASPTGPSSPASVNLPFPAGSGDRVFIRGRVTQADGRLSPSFHLHTTGPAIPGPAPYDAVYYPSPYYLCYVFFAPALHPMWLDSDNWSLRWNNQRYLAGSARAYSGYVRFSASSPAFSPGPNAVTYYPPPYDVVAAATGIPAAAFMNYPLRG